MEPATAPASDNASSKNGKRRRLLRIVAVTVALAGIAAALWWLMTGRYHEGTEDAQVNGHLVQITPRTEGTVIAIGADDTDFVKAGQTLVTLDESDADIALLDAESKLARAVRNVRNQKATAEQLAATVELRRADLAKANEDLARREKIQGSGAVSAEDVQHARDAQKTAQANLDAAGQQLKATRALVDNTTLRNHPDVMNAAAQVRNAFLIQSRTKIPAPVAGFVAKRSIQIGQHVNPGSALMFIAPLDQVWVDANFKESQLANIRVGQPVTLMADVYGSKVEYQGTVAGFSAGTGSAFSLLPAQNATGNWIKIVQRLSVRIVLDPKQVAAHPLQIGLSMSVDVDTHQRDGHRLTATPTERNVTTDVFQSINALADERVEKIIAANEGK